MKIMLSLSSPAYYRGLQVAFDQKVHDKSHIIWVTPNREYAMRYAADPSHLLKFNVDVKSGFKFGFRTFETEVKISDVVDRIRTALNERANSGGITKSQYKAVVTQLQAINDTDSGKFKKVWAWYMEDKRIAQALKAAGYDHVIGREGADDNIPTIGVFDPKNVKVAR